MSGNRAKHLKKRFLRRDLFKRRSEEFQGQILRGECRAKGDLIVCGWILLFRFQDMALNISCLQN